MHHELQLGYYDDCDIGVIELTQQQIEFLIEREENR